MSEMNAKLMTEAVIEAVRNDRVLKGAFSTGAFSITQVDDTNFLVSVPGKVFNVGIEEVRPAGRVAGISSR